MWQEVKKVKEFDIREEKQTVYNQDGSVREKSDVYLICLDKESFTYLQTLLTGAHVRGLTLPSRLRKKNRVLDFTKDLLDKIEEV